ncbi:MAG: hypothetical protein IJC43_09380 [Clostridia bacterium]|nr:hypothetical protein [Clostridia bacterium]
MKKIVALTLALLLMLSLAACSSSSGDTNPGADMTLSEIMTTILDGAVPAELAVGEMPLDEENFAFFAFIDPIEGAEGLASEAMMSSVAHSVVLLRLPEDADAAAVAAEVEKNADPRKWICVTAEKTEVLQHGNLVLLVMSATDTATAIAENFTAFCEG